MDNFPRDTHLPKLINEDIEKLNRSKTVNKLGWQFKIYPPKNKITIMILEVSYAFLE